MTTFLNRQFRAINGDMWWRKLYRSALLHNSLTVVVVRNLLLPKSWGEDRNTVMVTAKKSWFGVLKWRKIIFLNVTLMFHMRNLIIQAIESFQALWLVSYTVVLNPLYSHVHKILKITSLITQWFFNAPQKGWLNTWSPYI